MQSLPAHERRAPIEARWARLGPRVEAALALNCDALTRACLIDSIVRGGVRDGVNLSNEGLLEVYLARQSSGVRARGLSGCLPRVVQAHATTLHVLLSRQPQRTLAAADAAFREARSSDSRGASQASEGRCHRIPLTRPALQTWSPHTPTHRRTHSHCTDVQLQNPRAPASQLLLSPDVRWPPLDGNLAVRALPTSSERSTPLRHL